MGIRIKRHPRCYRNFNSSAYTQAASLAPVYDPTHNFGVRHIALRFSYCSTTDPIQNQLMPELIEVS